MHPDLHAGSLSRLGGYREYPVPRDLTRHVETVWSYGRPLTDGAGARATTHRVLPTSGASLLFQSIRLPDGQLEEPELLFIGPVRTPRLFTPPPGLHFEAVRIKLEWCLAVTGMSPGECTDLVVPLTNPSICGVRLLDDLSRSRSPARSLALLLDAVRQRRDAIAASRECRLVHSALEEIRRDPSSELRLEAVARKIGISERHLRRMVLDVAGFTPKWLQRVQRLSRTLAAADLHSCPSWSRLAADHGYWDQSHLIHEVRALTGFAPTESDAERRREDVLNLSAFSNPPSAERPIFQSAG